MTTGGRRTGLTPEIHEIIVTAIRAGAYDHEAARLADIHPATIRDWIRRGEQDDQNTINPDDHTLKELKELCRRARLPITGTKAQLAQRLTTASPFAAFASAVKRARAERTVDWREQLEEIARGGVVVKERVTTKKNGDEVREVEYARPQWQAFAWLLERTRPDDYGRRDRTDEVEPAVGADPGRVLEEGEIVVRTLRAVPDR